MLIITLSGAAPNEEQVLVDAITNIKKIAKETLGVLPKDVTVHIPRMAHRSSTLLCSIDNLASVPGVSKSSAIIIGPCLLAFLSGLNTVDDDGEPTWRRIEIVPRALVERELICGADFPIKVGDG